MTKKADSQDFEEEGVAITAAQPDSGYKVIQNYLKSLDNSPGVYRMLDAKGEVLYVGKARNLKRRVSNYARLTGHTARIGRMISATAQMMFLTTKTEILRVPQPIKMAQGPHY